MLKQKTGVRAWLTAIVLLVSVYLCVSAGLSPRKVTSVLLLVCAALLLFGALFNATILKLFSRDWTLQGTLDHSRDGLLSLLVALAIVGLAWFIDPDGLRIPQMHSLHEVQAVETPQSGWSTP